MTTKPSATSEESVTFTPKEERIRRLMVDISYLFDSSCDHFQNYMDKTMKAVDTPERDAADTLHLSAFQDATRAFSHVQIMMQALMGSDDAMNKVHDEFLRETSGAPN